jgi:hypothetical protein
VLPVSRTGRQRRSRCDDRDESEVYRFKFAHHHPTLLWDRSPLSNCSGRSVQRDSTFLKELTLLIHQAQERQEASFKAPAQKVTDLEELNEYRGRKRKEFEERIRYSRTAIKGNCRNCAQVHCNFILIQRSGLQNGCDMRSGKLVRTSSSGMSRSSRCSPLGTPAHLPYHRARSVFERALDVDARAVEIWVGHGRGGYQVSSHALTRLFMCLQLKYTECVRRAIVRRIGGQSILTRSMITPHRN